MFFTTKGNVTLSQLVTQMKLHVFVYFSYPPVYNVLHLVDVFLCMVLVPVSILSEYIFMFATQTLAEDL